MNTYFEQNEVQHLPRQRETNRSKTTYLSLFIETSTTVSSRDHHQKLLIDSYRSSKPHTYNNRKRTSVYLKTAICVHKRRPRRPQELEFITRALL